MTDMGATGGAGADKLATQIAKEVDQSFAAAQKQDIQKDRNEALQRGMLGGDRVVQQKKVRKKRKALTERVLKAKDAQKSKAKGEKTGAETREQAKALAKQLHKTGQATIMAVKQKLHEGSSEDDIMHLMESQFENREDEADAVLKFLIDTTPKGKLKEALKNVKKQFQQLHKLQIDAARSENMRWEKVATDPETVAEYTAEVEDYTHDQTEYHEQFTALVKQGYARVKLTAAVMWRQMRGVLNSRSETASAENAKYLAYLLQGRKYACMKNTFEAFRKRMQRLRRAWSRWEEAEEEEDENEDEFED